MDRADIDAVVDQFLAESFDIADIENQLDQRLAFFLAFASGMEHQDHATIVSAQLDDAVIRLCENLIPKVIRIELHHGVDLFGINDQPVARSGD